jgi:hypothetical protein
MKKELCDKIDSLSGPDTIKYYRRLNNVLNDRYSSFLYGGMDNKDYANFSVDKSAHDKLEIIEQKVYEEMFEGKTVQPA